MIEPLGGTTAGPVFAAEKETREKMSVCGDGVQSPEE